MKKKEMKVELMRGGNMGVLQEEINAFIKDKTVADIKYTSEMVTTQYAGRVPSSGNFYDSVLIMYFDEEEA